MYHFLRTVWLATMVLVGLYFVDVGDQFGKCFGAGLLIAAAIFFIHQAYQSYKLWSEIL